MSHLDLEELRNRSELCRRIGDWIGAKRLLAQAARQARKLKASASDCEQLQLELAQCLASAGSLVECERAFNKLIVMLKARAVIGLAAATDSQLDIANAYIKMGTAQMQHGAFVKARNRFQKACEIQRNYFSKDVPYLPETLCQIALTYSGQGRHGMAEKMALDALSLSEEVLSPWDACTAKVLLSMARLACASGHPQLAEGHLERAVAIMSELPEHRLDFACALSQLADLYFERGAAGKAQKLYASSLRELEYLKGSWCQEVAHAAMKLAMICRKNRKFGDASEHVNRVVAIHRKTKGALHPDVACALTELAGIMLDSQEFESAESTLSEVLSIQENRPTSVVPLELASTLYHFGWLYNATCRFAKSEEFYQRALLIQEEQLGTEALRLTDTLSGLAMIHWARRRHEKAEPLLLRALKIKEKHLGYSHPSLVETLKKLAGVLEAQLKFDDAGSCLDRAHLLEHEQHKQFARIWEA